ncbi:MAG: AsmA family protein, partial [Bacteroidota bacterium]
MKKIVKNLFIILFSLVAIVLAAALILPYVYKDDIKARIDQEIASKVNAHVYFSADKFDLTLFHSFPDITVTLEDFGVVGKGVFEGDTLTSIRKFRVGVDIMSVIGGGQIKVKEILLEGPRIHASRLKDGTANWDISIPDTAAAATPASTQPSQFSIKVSKWEIKDGEVVYSDAMLPAFAAIQGLNHSGSGDFTQDIVDLKTTTTIASLTAEYDSTEYLANKKLDAVLNMELNLPKSAYTFKDNSIKLNEFALAFGGKVIMEGDNIITDVNFKSTDNSIRGLISLVPGVFKKGFEDVKTDGTLGFDGYAKGTYNATTMPAFGLNLKVDKGMIQYPKLPSAITNLTLDMSVTNPDGNLEHTLTDVRKFHIDLGKN